MLELAVQACRGVKASRRGRRLLAATLLSMVLLPRLVMAGADDVRAVVLLRALAYDDGLRTRATDRLVIGVVVPTLAAVLDNPLHAGMKGLSGLTIQGLPLAVVDLPYTDAATFKRLLAAKDIDVLFLGRGLHAVAAEVVQAGRELRVPSMTISPEYLALGVAVAAVQSEQGDKPKLVVNLASAKAQGMLLRPELLRIAQVIE